MTSTNARDGRLLITLFIAAVLVQLPPMVWGAPNGKTMNNALRILNGDIPYRDFWTMYAPGAFYLSALLLKVFGRHLWVLSAGSVLLAALHGVIVFVIARRLGSSVRVAMATGFAVVGTSWGTHRSIGTYDTALVPLLLAIDRLVCYAQGHGPRTLVTAGLLLGVTAWFKHDVGLYVTAGAAAGLAAAWWLVPQRMAGWLSPRHATLRLGVSAFLGLLPMAAFIAWKARVDAWRDLIVFPGTDFRVVRGEGYPPLLPRVGWVTRWIDAPVDLQRAHAMVSMFSNWIMGVAPEIVFVGALVALTRTRRRLPGWAFMVAAVALGPMPFFWSAAHVQQNTHLTSLWLCSVVLIGLFLMREPRRTPWRIAASSLLVVHGAAALVPSVSNALELLYMWPERRVLTFPLVAEVRIPARNYHFYQPITEYIRSNVPEGEPIYVGLTRHDSVMLSNQTFYYLAGRPVASRYNELHPGIVDRDDIQQEIIADLERLNVRCAVLWAFGWPQAQMDQILEERRRTIPELGATRLDDYLRAEFEEVFRRGEYVVVWRKGEPRAPAPDA